MGYIWICRVPDNASGDFVLEAVVPSPNRFTHREVFRKWFAEMVSSGKNASHYDYTYFSSRALNGKLPSYIKNPHKLALSHS